MIPFFFLGKLCYNKNVIGMKKILIIEDDESVRSELKTLLGNAGYQVILSEDYQNMLDFIIKTKPDLVLLDINIPYMNGEVLLKNLRKVSNIPVIMVTSKNTEIDEVLSMSYGADDYITKPYNPTILLLRIGAVLKRSEKVLADFLSYHDLVIDVKKGIVKNGEEEIILTKNEMIIFLYLYGRMGSIVLRDELMTELWNNDEYINDNALTVNISRLRSKLRELGLDEAILTRKGQGYILVSNSLYI